MSPDGRYRWDGKSWNLIAPQSSAVMNPAPMIAQPQYPLVQHVDMRAGAAFRLGFFAFFGAGCASIVFWIALFIIVSLLGGLGALGLGALGSHT